MRVIVRLEKKEGGGKRYFSKVQAVGMTYHIRLFIRFHHPTFHI